MAAGNGQDRSAQTPGEYVTRDLARLKPEVTLTPPGAVGYRNDLNLRWNNALAANRVYQLTTMLNRNPNAVVPQEGGLVIWLKPPALNQDLRNQGYSYEKLEIQDVNYLHSKPVWHSDFMFLTLHLHIKPDKAKELMEISDSMVYYGVGHHLTATCGEVEANIATMVIAKMYNEGYISKIEARERYNQYIMTILAEFLANEKKPDLAQQPTPIRDSFEKYIFGVYDGVELQRQLERGTPYLSMAQGMEQGSILR